MARRAYLAIDLGASSGRHVAGLFDGRQLQLSEIYRFENGPVPAAGHLYWNLLEQWKRVCEGLRAAGSSVDSPITSIGVDTWGVDFGLLGRNDELLGNPSHYRDPRTTGMLERAFAIVPREEIFAATGVQFMSINTLYQLLAMQLADSPLLENAQSFLMMPDLFNWLLTGVKANELTDATTSQCFDPRAQNWAVDLLQRLGIPTQMFGPLSPPGTTLGPLRSGLVEELGLADVQVVLPGAHDTASAVMAVPVEGRTQSPTNWCYISSGTWSLMGVEVPRPIVDERTLARNFTNEGGVGGTTRLLKNIAGLWLVQECRRVWNQSGKNYSWEDLNAMAAAAPALAAHIDPDDPAFLAPSSMPTAIADYCRRTGQSPPADAGSVVRTAIESLALRYRQVLGWLEELTGGRIETIYVVGGGSQNRQLCQATADACARRVVAGPVEATAIGNVLMQAVTAHDIGSIAQAREIVRASFGVELYEPREAARWDEAHERFQALTASSARSG